MSELDEWRTAERRKKKKRNRRIALVLLIAAAGIAAAVFISRSVKMYRERDRLDAMRKQYAPTVEQYFADYVDLSNVEGAEQFGVTAVNVTCESELNTEYTREKQIPIYYWEDSAVFSVDAYSAFDDLSNVKIDRFLRSLAKECNRAYQELLNEKLPEYDEIVHTGGRKLQYLGHSLYYSCHPRYEVHTPENVYEVISEKPLDGWLYTFSKNGVGVDMPGPLASHPSRSSEESPERDASSGKAHHTYRSSTADSVSDEEDPYHAKEYADAEDFYEDYYDEFDDFEDAETYYDDHG